jgi:hypothetical protein
MTLDMMLLFVAGRYELATMDAPEILPAGSTKPAFGIDYSYRDIKVVPESSTFLRAS